jgi:protein-S-isoprenylcysteine O-methyltransferase Ste14
MERERVIMDRRLKMIWAGGIALMILETVLFGFFHDPPRTWLGNLGWVILWTAAFLAVIPILTFRKKGGVAEGKSYIKTTTLVDTGIYELVRHPQYLSFILICFGLILASQEWPVAATGIPAMILIYLATRTQDRFLVEKFGNAYTGYMNHVPRINIVLGVIRRLRRR